MPLIHIILACLCLLPALAAQSSASDLPPDLALLARAACQPAEYHASTAGSLADGVVRARHPAHALDFAFAPDGLTVTASGAADDELLHARLVAWGASGSLQRVSAAPVSADGARVHWLRESLDEWYLNGPAGLQHGFAIVARPAGGSDAWLELHVQFGGRLHPVLRSGAPGVALLDESGLEVLGYDGLCAWDAEGRALPVALQLRGRTAVLQVDAAGALFPLTVDPVISSVAQELSATPVEPGAAFGFAVSLAGDVAAFGAPHATVAGLVGAGRVYVYRKGFAWTLEAELTASDPAVNGRFGHALSLQDALLTVGAPGAISGGFFGAGAAYVFTSNGASWTQVKRLAASDAGGGDAYGTAVGSDGTTLIIGAPGNDTPAGTNAGRAYVVGKLLAINWVELAQLSPADAAAGHAFGSSVAVDGNTLAIGAPGRQSGRGAAYAFIGSDTAWTQQGLLTDPAGLAGDALGISVDVDGSTLLAGAPGRDVGGDGAGAAHVFLRTAGTWALQKVLESPYPLAQERFGTSVALDLNRAMVGAPGALAWSAAAGAWVTTGAACLYDRLVSTWSFQGRVIVPSAQAGDELGVDVDVEGARTVAGLWRRDVQGASDAGAGCVAGLTPDTVFFNIGLALGAPLLAPNISGTGSLFPGSSGSIDVEFARPLSPGILFVSLLADYIPFKGGTLVPAAPFALSLPVMTSASGTAQFPWAAWPGGMPAVTYLYFQLAVQDPGGPQGVALSNAIRGRTPQ